MNIQFITRATSRSIYYRCSNGVAITKILPFKLNPLDIWNKSTQLTNNNLYINKELLIFKSYLIDEVNNVAHDNENTLIADVFPHPTCQWWNKKAYYLYGKGKKLTGQTKFIKFLKSNNAFSNK